MKQKTKQHIIGFFSCTKEQVYSEYCPKYLDKEIPLIGVEIWTHSTYGAIAKIQDMHKPMFKMLKGMRKVFKNKPLDSKKVDTSKWVKPDKESIRNTLITECFAIQILKKDLINYSSHYSRVELLYSILHSHSPTNPQGLTDFAILNEPFEVILNECKTKYLDYSYHILFGKDGNKKVNMIKSRKLHKIWQKKMLKQMIKVIHNEPKKKAKI